MSFDYPLDHPENILPSQMSFEIERAIGATQSPYTKETQTYEWPGQVWKLSFNLPEMKRDEAREWLTFLNKLKGPIGTFKASDLNAEQPQGTAQGNPQIAPVANPNFVSFQGGDDHVDFGDNLDRTGTFSYEFWFYTTDNTTNNQRLFVKHDQGTGEGFHLSLNGDNIESYIDGLSDSTLSTGNIVNRREWTHVAVVWDSNAGEHYIYVNGEQEALDTGLTGTPTSTTTALGLGADPAGDSGTGFNGWIDDVRMWSDARTQTEIQDNADNELVGNETGLEAYWNINSGSGNVLDQVGSVDGTLQNDTEWVTKNVETVAISNWSANQSAALEKMDYIEFNDEYKMVMDQVSSNALGFSTVTVQPNIHKNPPSNETVVTDDPHGLFQLDSNNLSWDLRTIMYRGISFEAREVV